ncbi:MAG: T9SS type A sorting domain-containing protein, partial [Calditrichia bacterium]|nr:T9SS type A sorting domain-containing protein [Calditrichia bacterium]
SDMLEAVSGSINNQGGLTNSGEMAVLYYWDGQSDLVQDVDYLVWGDKVEAVDKSGISIDGPDPDTTPSTYLNDTGIAQQISVPENPHTFGESVQRLNLIENGETQTGGNGITGNDETSEDLATSFQIDVPNPGTGPSSSNAPFISNLTTGHFDAGIAIDIDADMTDDQGIDEAWLHFRQNLVGAEDSVQMSNTSGDTYQGTIPAQTNNTGLEYWVSATDIDGTPNYSTSSIQKTLIGIADISRAHELDGNGNMLYDNFLAKIKGIVTVATGTFSATYQDDYMQDNTGGINVFDFAVIQSVALGDSVEVAGRFSNYNAKSEILDFIINVLSSGNPVPAPTVITTVDMAEQYEGMLIRINQGLVSAWNSTTGSSYNAIFTDASGDLTLRIDNDTDLIGQADPQGFIDLIGIGSQNDNVSPYLEGYQIMPRSWADFLIPNSIDEEINTPFEFSLKQNFPNPFNPNTEIEYTLAKNSDVKMVIYNLLGQEIKSFSSQNIKAGVHHFNWNGRDNKNVDVASGIYIYRLTAGDFVSTKKMALLR